MNDSTLHVVSYYIRFAVITLTRFSFMTATWLLLSTFLWGWLAYLLACIAGIAVGNSPAVRAFEGRASDLAVAGATKAAGWLKGLRAKVAA